MFTYPVTSSIFYPLFVFLFLLITLSYSLFSTLFSPSDFASTLFVLSFFHNYMCLYFSFSHFLHPFLLFIIFSVFFSTIICYTPSLFFISHDFFLLQIPLFFSSTHFLHTSFSTIICYMLIPLPLSFLSSLHSSHPLSPPNLFLFLLNTTLFHNPLSYLSWVVTTRMSFSLLFRLFLIPRRKSSFPPLAHLPRKLSRLGLSKVQMVIIYRQSRLGRDLSKEFR